MAINNQPFFNALLYSDIFNYPLTTAELWRYAFSEGNITEKVFSDFLKNPPAYIDTSDGYYFLKGRRKIAAERKRRELISQKKLLIARYAASVLANIPSILFIGISGSLAMKNADSQDDIDFFIICRKNTLWQTRLLTACILQMLGLRRKRRMDRSSDKICTNMFVDERSMRFGKKRQDLFTAHEVVQMQPMFDRAHTYQRFLQANAWIEDFLPNAAPSVYSSSSKRVKNPVLSVGILSRFWIMSSFGEVLAKRLQLWYMKRHKTVETVTDSMLAFHPVDYRAWTLQRFRKLQEAYEKI